MNTIAIAILVPLLLGSAFGFMAALWSDDSRLKIAVGTLFVICVIVNSAMLYMMAR